jgi:phosphotransferase system enzyme I (PtsI)
MSDPYLKERTADIMHASDRIMRNLAGVEERNIADIDKRVVLVAVDLSPAETSQIHLEKIKGFITDRGGQASHTGIIARTLEIPAVLGMGNATATIKNDDLVIVDGTNGRVILHPDEQTLIEYENRSNRYDEFKAQITRRSHLPAETKDGVRIRVMANIELPEEVVSAINYGSDGIGLYRTEFQYLSRPDFPDEYELFDKYKDVVEVMAPKPVTIRTLDINGDKPVSGRKGNREVNPALGLRAIRYCLHNPDMFVVQLRAILRAAAYGKVRILIPMISTYEELLAAKQMVKRTVDSLSDEGCRFEANIEFGIMIEVPSTVFLADIMAESVDFFSIGTNDLIQYSMAMDRGNSKVAHLYQPLNPAIIRMLKHVTDAARDKGIKVFMCGEMAADPISIPILMGLHLDELSMNPQSIPVVKSIIRSICQRDTRQFLLDVMRHHRTDQITAMVTEAYGSILSDLVYPKNGNNRNRPVVER